MCLAFMSCTDANGDSEQTLLDVPVESSKPFDASFLNDILARQSEQGQSASSSLLAALVSLAPDTAPQASMILTARDSDTGNYRAIAIFDAVPDDDSVSGYRYDITVRIGNGGVLEIIEGSESWRCWEDRGHQTFSTEPCH